MLSAFDELESNNKPSARRDWSSDFLALEAAGRAKKEAAQRAMAAARVKGTSPSLPLSGYVGSFAYEPYGEVTVVEENGRLLLNFNPAYIGDLTHWHYDTFHVSWRNPILDDTYLTFNFGAKGKIEGIIIEALQGLESH